MLFECLRAISVFSKIQLLLSFSAWFLIFSAWQHCLIQGFFCLFVSVTVLNIVGLYCISGKPASPQEPLLCICHWTCLNKSPTACLQFKNHAHVHVIFGTISLMKFSSRCKFHQGQQGSFLSQCVKAQAQLLWSTPLLCVCSHSTCFCDCTGEIDFSFCWQSLWGDEVVYCSRSTSSHWGGSWN